MHSKLEKQGLVCSYLDFTVTCGRGGHIAFDVYNKRDELPVFHDYRRFPHIDSVISDRSIYGVFSSQLHSFASRSSTFHGFEYNALRLLTEMITSGYSYKLLRKPLAEFQHDFVERQRMVFGNQIREPENIWKMLMFNSDRKAKTAKKRQQLKRKYTKDK
jgi:hypothetical protein